MKLKFLTCSALFVKRESTRPLDFGVRNSGKQSLPTLILGIVAENAKTDLGLGSRNARLLNLNGGRPRRVRRRLLRGIKRLHHLNRQRGPQRLRRVNRPHSILRRQENRKSPRRRTRIRAPPIKSLVTKLVRTFTG